ncbi:MAG: hypothetical protein K5657_03300 [Desulfovibrio sp.]|nr:hypothetical protein [Desulfovibrio sp.]
MLKAKLRSTFSHFTTEPESWLEGLSLTIENGVLKVTFPHLFFGTWFFLNKQDMFEKAVHICFGDEVIRISYQEQEKVNTAKEKRKKTNPVQLPYATTVYGENKETLESYCYNEKNAFPLSIIRKIITAEPGSIYSLVILEGESGTGKTHLLHAIAQKFRNKFLSNVLISTVHDLTYADYLRSPEHLWKECSAFFVDDIQDIEHEPHAQKILLHCLNSCPLGKQLILTSDRSITSLSLNQRLLQRLKAGLVLSIQKPDLDVRLQFVQQLCGLKNISLAKKQMLLLAQQCSEYRQLQGTLLKISAITSVKKKNISVGDIEEIISDHIPRKTIDSSDVVKCVAELTELEPDEILGSSRQYKLVLARQLAMYLCRTLLGLSYPEVGRFFGGKDHSTVIHAIRKIEKKLVTDKDLNNMLTELKALLC